MATMGLKTHDSSKLKLPIKPTLKAATFLPSKPTPSITNINPRSLTPKEQPLQNKLVLPKDKPSFSSAPLTINNAVPKPSSLSELTLASNAVAKGKEFTVPFQTAKMTPPSANSKSTSTVHSSLPSRASLTLPSNKIVPTRVTNVTHSPVTPPSTLQVSSPKDIHSPKTLTVPNHTVPNKTNFLSSKASLSLPKSPATLATPVSSSARRNWKKSPVPSPVMRKPARVGITTIDHL